MRPAAKPLLRCALGLLALAVGCRSDEPTPPLPPGAYAFAVLSDGPYSRLQELRFERVVRELDAADLAFVIHVGDIFYYPCSDGMMRTRYEQFMAIRHPLIYTPGDNEWSDCHEPIAGRYSPSERLARLREIFFAEPGTSLGAAPIALTSQSEDEHFAEFVEHVRWTRGRIVFATIHLVGTKNGMGIFPGRTEEDDDEVLRRTDAAVAWLRATFAEARELPAQAVVIAFHADPAFGDEGDASDRQAYGPILRVLEDEATSFAGSVLLVHGDSHFQRVDKPLRRSRTGDVVGNVTRLETYGSPDIGWVRVVVDTLDSAIFRFEPRKVPRWVLW